MGYSLKLKIDKKYVRDDGTCSIFFQVIINRKKARIGLDISWPPNKFSPENGCLQRRKNDEDVETYNIVIGNARTRANDIRRYYLIRNIHLTMESFLKDFHSDLNKNDFVKYFETKSTLRWKRSEISNETYEKECGTLKRLKEFTGGTLPFHDFTTKWGKEFDKDLQSKHKNSKNTRWGRHKHVITYLNMARDDDKIPFDDPYSKFNNTLVESSWGPLEVDQLTSLIKFYDQWKAEPLPLLPRKNGQSQEDLRKGLTAPEVVVLRKFLFSCNSSLRVSDMQKLDTSIFSNGRMSITPHKTETYGTKIKDVALTEIAVMLLEDEMKFINIQRSGTPFLKTMHNKSLSRIFEAYTDQACNRLLKRIAKKLELDVNLHMHVGRYTYGSLMDEAGANHTALMKQMGIRKRDTLNKYVKTNEKRISGNVEQFNKMVSDSSIKPDK